MNISIRQIRDSLKELAEKMQIYKAMIQEEQIRKHTVIVNEKTGSTVVEYYAIAPHEWILEQMRQRA